MILVWQGECHGQQSRMGVGVGVCGGGGGCKWAVYVGFTKWWSITLMLSLLNVIEKFTTS